MKKLLSLALAFAMLCSMTVSSFAAGSDSDTRVVQVGEYTIEITPSDGIPPMPREKIWIPLKTHNSSEAFKRFFTCDPNEGNRTNIWIDNRDGLCELTIVLWLNGEMILDPRLNMAAGKAETYKITQSGQPMTGSIGIEISSANSQVMYFQIAARQFWDNTL